MTINELRQYSIFGYAVFDLVLTYVGMFILSFPLSWMFRKINIDIPIRSWLIWALPIGIIFHVVFNNLTLMTKQFLDLKGYYLLKVIIIGMIPLGFIGVKFKKSK